jgi:hypothetical protein
VVQLDRVCWFPRRALVAQVAGWGW